MSTARTLSLVLRASVAAVLVCLLLPWFSGQDEARPLEVAGWDTEPGFTIGMIAAAVVLAVSAGPGREGIGRWLPLAAGVVMVALTLWMLPRGDRYSVPELQPAAYAALGLEVVLLAAAVAFGTASAPVTSAGREAGRARP
jgi:hypothetical protein